MSRRTRPVAPVAAVISFIDCINRGDVEGFARYVREGGWVKTEDDPLDPNPPSTTRESMAAMRHLDEAVTAAGGIALRYGGFYGADNDGLVDPVLKRRMMHAYDIISLPVVT